MVPCARLVARGVVVGLGVYVNLDGADFFDLHEVLLVSHPPVETRRLVR